MTRVRVDELVVSDEAGFACSKNKLVDKGLPHLRPFNIADAGTLDFTQVYLVPPDEAPKGKSQLVTGDILFNNTNSAELVGKSAVVNEPMVAGFSNHLTRVRVDRNRVDPLWFGFWLRRLRSTGYFTANATQWVSQAAYRVSDLRKLELELPPIDEQRRIVDVLSRAEGIVRLRRDAQAKAAEIIPALFLDMFGDPATNPKGWEEANFGDIVVNRDGMRRPVKAADRADRRGEYPYYGASGIIDYVDDYLFDGVNLLIAEDGANLLSRSTPIAFQATGRYWVNNHAHVVGPTERADLTYLEVSLNVRDLRDSITGSAQPKLTQRALNSILLPLPPPERQRQFAAHVAQIRSIHQQQLDATGKAEGTFQVLLARAFSDDLGTTPRVAEEAAVA